MKRLIFLTGLIFCFVSFSAQVLNQSFFFDFGPSDTTNGDVTVNPDLNGNYWNNINPVVGAASIPLNTQYTSLKNSNNAASSVALTFSVAGFKANGKNNGGLLSPYASQFGNNAELAVATATDDYIYTDNINSAPVITFSGLDKSKQYRFKIFSCRNTNATRTSQYTLQGSGTAVVGTLSSSSASGLGGTVYIGSSISYPANLNVSYTLTSTGSNTQAVTYYGNNSTVFYSDYILPDSNGNITLTTQSTTTSSAFAYINCMKLEEYTPNPVDVSSIDISGNDISVNGATSQMSIVYTPSDATPRPVSWSVDNTSIGTISSSGLITPLKNGTLTVTASIVQNNVTITATKVITISHQITELYLSGTATVNGDNPLTALRMNQAMGVSGPIPGVFELETTLTAGGTFQFYSSTSIGNATLFGAGTSAGSLQMNGNPITSSVSGLVLIRAYLLTNNYQIYPVQSLKISQMGSSVSFGTGATNNQGYAYRFSQLLNQRFNAGQGLNWTVSNISVPGNNTLNVLDRWDTDLLNDDSQYVVYALSLGNEGIVGGEQAVFDQFKNNMLLLIEKARSVGKIPVVTNCYSRADFTATEYNFTKQMDLLIHEWDVPSINMLGAVDDGTGRWPVGYQYDTYHPNDAGHAEMSYAIVPSLFDAIQAGKQQPQRETGTYLSMGSSVNTDRFTFTPDNLIHSFTTSIDIKTVSPGIIETFTQGTATGIVKISSLGYINYISPNGGTIAGSNAINDGNWHKITLTHYYAWGKTFLYVDANLVGNISEKLTATDFSINQPDSPAMIDYRDWFFYRSGMNQDEITALNDGKMLKSSLELYAPLDGQKLIGNDPLVNLAQSTNVIHRIGKTNEIFQIKTTPVVTVFPNPVIEKLKINQLTREVKYRYHIFTLEGKNLVNAPLENFEIPVADLPDHQYLLSINDETGKNWLKNLKFVKVSN